MKQISPADQTRTHLGLTLDVWTTQAAVRYGPVIDATGFEFVKIDILTGTLAADITTVTVEVSAATGSGFAAVSGASMTITGTGGADADENTVRTMYIRMHGKAGPYLRVTHAGTAAAVAHEYGAVVTLCSPTETLNNNMGKSTNDTASGAVTYDAAVFDVA